MSSVNTVAKAHLFAAQLSILTTDCLCHTVQIAGIETIIIRVAHSYCNKPLLEKACVVKKFWRTGIPHGSQFTRPTLVMILLRRSNLAQKPYRLKELKFLSNKIYGWYPVIYGPKVMLCTIPEKTLFLPKEFSHTNIMRGRCFLRWRS